MVAGGEGRSSAVAGELPDRVCAREAFSLPVARERKIGQVGEGVRGAVVHSPDAGGRVPIAATERQRGGKWC
jgi:hypothetical protein